VGSEIWNKLKIPVYFYEAAARRPERGGISKTYAAANSRRCSQEMGTVPERHPDLGDPVCHPRPGATVVGARKFSDRLQHHLGTGHVGIAKKDLPGHSILLRRFAT